MTRWLTYSAGLAAFLGLMPAAVAQQFPGIASPTPTPAAPVAGDAAAAPAAPQNNLFSFLCPTQAQKQACKQCICQSQLGLLLNNGLAPVTAFSGGLIPSLCPGTPTAQELADQGAVGTAAKIKKEEAEAKARRAAVRYLGTVSCHYFPAAEAALIGSLRGDTNECVRYEAALALGSGCCCTKKTIQALVVCVSGSNEDKKPAELSPRVKAAAEVALLHCLDCYKEIVPAEVKKPEKETGKPKGPEQTPPPVGAAAPVTPGIQLTAYYAQVENESMADIVARARQVISRIKEKPVAANALPATLPTGERGMFNILNNAVRSSPQPPVADANRPAPAATQVAMTAPTMPPLELEPPTDLYHVLKAWRKERQGETTPLKSSESQFTRETSKGSQLAAPAATASAFAGPFGYVDQVPPPAPATTPAEQAASESTTYAPASSASTGYQVIGGEAPAGYEKPSNAQASSGASNGYHVIGEGTPAAYEKVSSPEASPSASTGYHVIGEGTTTTPMTTVEPPVSLAQPAPQPNGSSGADTTPPPQAPSAGSNLGKASPYHVFDASPPVALAQPQIQPRAQGYAQFPAPGDAVKVEALRSQTTVAPAERGPGYAQFPAPFEPAPPREAAAPPAPAPLPAPPVVQAQAETPAPLLSQAQPEAPAPLPVQSAASVQPSVPVTTTLFGALLVLRDAPEANHREWAATQLAVIDWTGNDEVLPALLAAMCKDPEAKVRIQCIHCLVRKKVSTVPVIRALQSLKADVDAQVRQEASQALAYLVAK